jgi:F0F1-type ATP synthase assembly protein I
MLDKSSKSNSGGLFVAAGVLTGMGVGFLVDNLVGGMFLGMGLCFLCYAIVSYIDKK